MPESEKEQNIYEVQIAGVGMKLRSSHDEKTVNGLIDIVNQKIQDSLKQGKNISFQNAILIAALNMAEDLFLLKETAKNDLNKLESQAQRILSKIESSSMSQIWLNN